MPIYEYKCESCGCRFERLQTFTEEPLKVCPRCGGTVKKLISRSSFILKGSGWYATDYARKSGGNEGEPIPSNKSSSSCTSCTSKTCNSCSLR